MQFEQSIDKLNSIDGSLQLLEGAFKNFVRQSSIGVGRTNNLLSENNILLTDMVNILQSLDGYTSAFFDEFSQGTETLEEDEEKMTMSLSRLGIVMAALTASGKKLFNGILEWSPSLAAAFAVMEVNLGLAAMEIGEALAPVIEEFLVPATEKFLNFVQNLSPEMKKFLGLTIALIVPLGVVAGIIMFALSPIGLMTLAIIGVTIVIAAIIAAIVLFGGKVKEVMVGSANKMREFLDNIQDKFIEARQMVDGFIGVIIGIPLAIAGFAVGIVATISDIFAFVMSSIGNFIGALQSLFTGDIMGFFIGLGNIILDFVNLIIGAINNLILAPLSILTGQDYRLNNIPSVEELIGGATQTGTGGGQGGSDKTVDQILAEQGVPQYHSGGIFMGNRPGLAMLKPKERVLTETDQRALGLKGPATQTNDMTSNNITYNITIQGGTYTSPAQRRMEAEGFARQLEKQSNSRGFI